MKKVNQKEIKKLANLFEKRVNKGVKWLDSKFTRRDWMGKIKISNLDLQNNNTCMCGQIFGDFFDVFYVGHYESGKYSNEEAIENGFQIEEEITDKFSHAFDLLTYIWFKKFTELNEKKFKNGFKI